MRRTLFLSLVLVGLGATLCAAEEPGRGASSPSFQQRPGAGDPGRTLILGASAGLGNSSPGLCDGCRTGLDVGFRGGVVLKSRLALQVEGQFLSVAPNILSKDGAKHDALLGTVQYWPAE